jgi:Alginate lyase
VNGKRYHHVTSGPLTGYFVSADQASAERGEVPPVPAPSASAAPSPSVAPSASPRPSTPPTPPPTPAPTPPAQTPVPSTGTPPVTAGAGIVVSRADVLARPMSGPAWDNVKRTADAVAGRPNLADLNQETNVHILAKALVYARTGVAGYRTDVIAGLKAAIGTEAGAETLALGRELAAYVIAADLVGLKSADPAFDVQWRAWLRGLLDRPMVDGNSLTQTHERRPNNWGTHAGASRAAAAAYLGDSAELARVATVFRGWLGERQYYSGFTYGDLWWQSNPGQPVGINPPGSTIDGRSVDGVLPDDQRRTGEFTWPPPCGNYPHGAMDGALLTAEILHRAGYDAYNWGSKGLLRAEKWLQSTGCPPSGDNVWQLPLLDYRYGTSYWGGGAARPGKNFGWTDWLYGP